MVNKVSNATSSKVAAAPQPAPTKELLQISSLHGIAVPIPPGGENVTLRLSGHWLKLWNLLKAAEHTLSPSEILRQAIAIRASMSAVDSDGNKPQVLIRFKNEHGEMVTKDLEEHIGMKPTKTTI